MGLFKGFRVWRVWYWFEASTHLEARGLGGFLTCEDDFGIFGKVFVRPFGHADDPWNHLACLRAPRVTFGSLVGGHGKAWRDFKATLKSLWSILASL